MIQKYNPGDRRAVLEGCTCSVEKNHGGKGETIATGRRFYLSRYCPLHGDDYQGTRPETKEDDT